MGKTNFKDKWKSLVEKHGKKKIYGGISAIVLVLLLCIFGIIWSMTSTPKTQSNDPLDHVTGIRNWKIVIDTEDVDFMQGVEWDEKYINEVTVESEEVDLTKIGEYTITYVIDVKDTKKDVEEDRTVEVISKEEEKESEQKKDEESKDKEKEDTKESSTSDQKDASKETASTSSNTSSSSKGNSSNSSSSSKPSGDSSNGSKPNGGGSSENKPSHTHNWQPQYKTVHHDAVYEQQWVVDVPYQSPKYEIHTVCYNCGMDFTAKGFDQSDVTAHMKAHTLNGDNYGYGTSSVLVSPEIPEQGHYENVLVSGAYDEQVLVGYKCSCGLIQN